MARSEVTIEFSGTENLKQIFNKLPEVYAKKPVQAAFRKAAAPFVKAARSGLPGKLSSLAKVIGIVNNKKGAGITAGVLSKKAFVTFRDGKQWDAFFPIYWASYGTLSNRDSGHTFIQKRKAISANKRGGMVPLRFIDKAWNSTKDQAEKIALQEMVTQTDKFLKKYAI